MNPTQKLHITKGVTTEHATDRHVVHPSRRSRILTTISRGVPDRVPIGMDCWADTRRRIYAHYGAKDHYDFYDKSGVDNLSLWDWPCVEPRYLGPKREHNTTPSVAFGLWDSLPEVYHPLEHEPMDEYVWPRVDFLDFSGIKAGLIDAHQHDMVSISSHISVGLNHHIRMRGYESAMYDVLDDAFMDEYMARLRGFCVPYLRALFKSAGGLIDIIRADEDVGGNDALLINPITWRKWYLPLWRELFSICHQNGAKVWLHSCGYCRDIVEDFIEMGADILDPIPPYVKGSDPGEMKAAFGDRLCLHGGINQIDALIYGTPKIVRREVKLRMEQLKPRGGYICGASQVLTDQIPLPNIIAFFDAALEMGKY